MDTAHPLPHALPHTLPSDGPHTTASTGMPADMGTQAANGHDADGASPVSPAPDSAIQKANTQRLHYLFRRTPQQPHVLQKALFTYRGTPLP